MAGPLFCPWSGERRSGAGRGISQCWAAAGRLPVPLSPFGLARGAWAASGGRGDVGRGRGFAAGRESSAAASRAAMGFGLALGCPEGHSALLQLQESEVRLLEGLRKWMGQRAKSDREYAALLHQMHSLAGKQEGGRPPRLGGQIGQVGSPGLPSALLRKLFGLPRPAPSRSVDSGAEEPRRIRNAPGRARLSSGAKERLLRWGWVCPGSFPLQGRFRETRQRCPF